MDVVIDPAGATTVTFPGRPSAASKLTKALHAPAPDARHARMRHVARPIATAELGVALHDADTHASVGRYHNSLTVPSASVMESWYHVALSTTLHEYVGVRVPIPPEGPPVPGVGTRASARLMTTEVVGDHGPYPKWFHVRTFQVTRPALSVRGAATTHVPPVAQPAWVGVNQICSGESVPASVIHRR